MPSSINILSSASSSIPNNHEYTVDRIKYRLQQDKSNFKVIGNDTPTFKSKCWNFFGFPAQKNATGDYERIIGFVSCRQCFKTYKYTPTTGTRHLNSHSCVVNFTESNSSTSTSTQMTLDKNILRNLKQIRLFDPEKKNFKSLMAKWICEDLRPFSISEDVGLRKVFQELISLGNFV